MQKAASAFKHFAHTPCVISMAAVGSPISMGSVFCIFLPVINGIHPPQFHVMWMGPQSLPSPDNDTHMALFATTDGT